MTFLRRLIALFRRSEAPYFSYRLSVDTMEIELRAPTLEALMQLVDWQGRNQ